MLHASPRPAALAIAGLLTASAVLTATPAWAAAPVNDDYSDAVEISGASGNVEGTNVDATTQEGEPGQAGDADSPASATVWYDWTAPADGTVQFRTFVDQDGLDTVLDVFTGDSLDALDSIAYDDDGGGNFTSRVLLDAEEGTTYRVRVSSFGDESTGPFLLTWGAPDAESRTAIKLKPKAKVGARPVARIVVRVLGEEGRSPARGFVSVDVVNDKSEEGRFFSKRLKDGVAKIRLPKLKKGTTYVFASYTASDNTIGSSADDQIKATKKKKRG